MGLQRLDPTIGHDPLLKAIAIMPKVGGSLSMIGSTLVLRDIGHKWGGVPLTTEVVAHITVTNLIIAFWECFLSTWMVPKDSMAFGAAGNRATCNVQGFISVAAFLMIEISYAILSVLYWIIVARGWTERKTQRLRMRFLFLGLPVVAAVAFASVMAAMGMYNFTGAYSCFIEEYPLNCDIMDDECTRGQRARAWQGGLFSVALASTIIVVVFMGLLVSAIWRQERRNDRYATQGQKKHRKNTRLAFWQAARYISVFLVSNFPLYLLSFYDLAIAFPPRWVILSYVIVWPAFGVTNAFAYFRPKYLACRQRSPGCSAAQCLSTVLDFQRSSSTFGESSVGEDEGAPVDLLEGVGDDARGCDEDPATPLIRDERREEGVDGDEGITS